MEQHHICLINDSFPPAVDGVANAVMNYGSIIQRSLGSATVVTPNYPGWDDSVYPYEVVRYPSINTTKLVGYRAGIPYSPEVMGKLEKGGFDLIHSHCPITSTMLARELRERIHAPIVFTYHTKFDIEINGAVRNKLLREEAAAALVENIAACDEVWVVSRGAGENLRNLGYTGESIVMPNGVDLPKGRADETQIAAVTEGYDLPADIPVFLFVGRIRWYKGIRIILDALRQLSDAQLAYRMVFVGDGSDREEIRAYTTSLGLDGQVIFVDPIRDREIIRAWYCRADLFLFPSTFDTNGLVVREAAACALASVLVRGSCAAEDVTDRQNGFLIEENADSMAAVLKELLANPSEMKRVGEGAQRELYLSWDDAVHRAYERYGVVIDNYRSGRCPEHKKLSDAVYRAVAGSLDALTQVEHLWTRTPAQVKTKVKSGLTGLKGGLQTGLEVSSRKIDQVEEFAQQFYDRFL